MWVPLWSAFCVLILGQVARQRGSSSWQRRSEDRSSAVVLAVAQRRTWHGSLFSCHKRPPDEVTLALQRHTPHQRMSQPPGITLVRFAARQFLTRHGSARIRSQFPPSRRRRPLTAPPEP